MFLFSVLMFFMLACFCAWLVLFPAARDAVMQTLFAAGRGVEQRLRGGCRSGIRQAVYIGADAGAAGRRSLRFVQRRYLLLLSALVLVAVPSLLALMLSGRHMLSGYDNDAYEINDQVASLLKGEQLTAPAPLPPLAFTTAEVALVRPMLDSANRNWQLLDPEFAQRLLLVFKIMKERHGYDMAILEGYRSPERQNALAAAGPGVTNATAASGACASP